MAGWFDPDTWKSFADSLSLWQKIAGSIVAMGGLLGTLLGWFARPLRSFASKFRRAKPTAPSTAPVAERPLRFVTNDDESRWSLATRGEEQGAMLYGRWHVTNVSKRNIVILKARIEGHETEFSHVMTQAPNRNVFSFTNPILAGRMSEVSADFAFFPSIGSGRDAIVADVIFTDNYGEAHRVNSVRFRRVGP